ncbi:GNAT family N-acetyltransferase [Comamonas sp. J-3]|uniref:GNAT family N-acetyltransferase n=1 Tax=Comamonas trifloxystrobinivorans TaxID=3350256 RepID=UPI003727A916
MITTKEWFASSVSNGMMAFFPFFGRQTPDGKKPRTASSMVPIRALSERHRSRIAAHLLSLDEQDRYLRFGYAASDAQIQRYVDNLNFERDEIFGVYNRGLKLIAMAHVAYAPASSNMESCAEFGVSVLKSGRGKGLGSRLFERAAMDARTKGVEMLFIHALSENTAMLKIARKAGAKVERDGSESEAYLKLPPAGFDTRMADLVEDHMGEMDYQFKKQARQFWAFLATVQEVRRDVQNGRHQSGQ